MARLSEFRVDSRAIADGAWVRVDEALYGDLDILTRGFTDDFIDAQTARLARAATPYGGNQEKIPNAERRKINASLLRDFLVLDVRNLLDDADQPVSVQAFHGMLDDPAYYRLARACFEAAGRVSSQSEDQLRHALGNSGNGLSGT
jgi:hypothetical protein